jgi:hypothetical protein
VIEIEQLNLLNDEIFNKSHLQEIMNNDDQSSFLNSNFLDNKYQIIIEKKSNHISSILVISGNEIVFYVKLTQADKNPNIDQSIVDVNIWKTLVIDYQKDLSGFTEHLLCSYILKKYIVKFPNINDPHISSDLWFRMLGHFSIDNQYFAFVRDNDRLMHINDKHFSSREHTGNVINIKKQVNIQDFYRQNYKFYSYLLISNTSLR